MRVLVTGGAGYIGSVVTEALLAGGHEVVVYDNLSHGHRDAVPDGVPFIHADLLAAAALRDVFQRFRVEAVVHMAADSLVGESTTNPGKYYRNNVQGGLALLEAMREAGVQPLVFSSSAAVYGEPAKQPIAESDVTAPSNPYGETKLALERAFPWYERAHGLREVSLRYFNAAGATERSGERHDPETHLIPLVLEAAAGRRPHVTIFGDDYPTHDGTCVRDYIHVIDLAAAHVLALHHLAGGGAPAAYNLGCGGAGYTVRDVIEVAGRVTGHDIPVTIGPRRPGDPPTLVAASDRITQDLDWHPRHQDLEQIIASAWSWMQRRH